jgi:hypothetical protein
MGSIKVHIYIYIFFFATEALFQEPDPAKDAEAEAKVNHALNNPEVAEGMLFPASMSID